MPLSARYKELSKRLTQLRKNLLPKDFDPTGSYSAYKLDRARGYRLLAHAEIEAYIEDIAKESAATAFSEFKNKNKASQIITSIQAMIPNDFPCVSDYIKNRRKYQFKYINERVENSIKKYGAIIDGNHGIKEDNVLKILLPLGINESSIDTILLNDLNTLGSSRGEVAHTSHRIQKQIDPKRELQMVKRILLELRNIDTLVSDAAKH